MKIDETLDKHLDEDYRKDDLVRPAMSKKSKEKIKKELMTYIKQVEGGSSGNTSMVLDRILKDL